VAAKVSLRGDAIGVRVSEMRITRPNDILVVQADFGNAERTDRMVFYRFKWLDAVGNQVGDGESWKQLTVLGLGQQTVKSVAPAGVATDFRLEMYVMQTQRLLCIAALAGVSIMTGCTTKSLSAPVVRFDRQVNYGDAKAVELVTNEFGSSDLQMIAEKMTGSLLETGIFQGRPTVTISTVKNKTSEYIDTTNVMNSIQTTLVKSGKVRFTRAISEMQPGVDELQRQNQSGLYKQTTTAKVGQMTAARYSMEGELTSIVKQSAATKDVYYKFTLKLFDVQEGTIEWQDEKEIRKTTKR
jgi:uncharacterized protein (TIGR02722 family)